jgi:hypothetical protein
LKNLEELVMKEDAVDFGKSEEDEGKGADRNDVEGAGEALRS